MTTPRRPDRPAEGARPRAGALGVLRAFAALEGTSRARDRAALFALLLMPLFVLAVVGLALRGYSTPQLVLGVLDRSGGGPAAHALVRSLEEDPLVRVRTYAAEEPMRLATYRGRLHGGLVLPADFSLAPGPGPLLYAATAGAGTPVLRAILDRALARAAHPDAAGSAIAVVDGGALGSPPVGYQYTAPSNLVLFVILNAIVGSGFLVWLRRTGLGTRLAATPVGPGTLTLGLAAMPAQRMALQAVFLVVVGALVFEVHWGSLAGVVLVTSALVAVGVGLTLFLGTVFGSERQATAFGPFLGILLGMLGGCMWPLEVVPDAVAAFGHVAPTAWAMDAYLALGFGGAGVGGVLPEIAVLLAMGLLLGGVGALRLRTSLGRRG